MALVNIIQYEGDNTTFVWKHPRTDFNTMSQLIVHENQEAVFYKNGQALDLFEAGKYTLSTDNIPVLRRFINIPTGGKTAQRNHLQQTENEIICGQAQVSPSSSARQFPSSQLQHSRRIRPLARLFWGGVMR